MPSNLDREAVRVALTPSAIARLVANHRASPTAADRLTVADAKCAGLRLVIGPRTASFIYSFRPRGLDPDGRRLPQRKVVLGDAADLHPADARLAAERIKREVAAGRDPAAERDAERATNTSRRTAAAEEADARRAMIVAILTPPDATTGRATALDFSVLADAPLDDCATAYALHGVTGSDTHRAAEVAHLRRAIAELQAGRLRPGELRKPAVAGLARAHSDRPATGRHRLGALGRLYKFLLEADAVQTSPVLGVRSPAPPPPRSRVYAAAEVQRLWQAADRLPDTRRDYLRLAILLPLRRAELAGLRVRDIVASGDRLELVLAPAATKNRREHRLPLVGEARAIVERLLASGRPATDFLIPLTSTGLAFDAWRRFAEAVRYAAVLDDFNFHDLRRLFATEAGEHGLGDFAVIDGILNHAGSLSKPGAARAYHHARLVSQRVAVLTAWDRAVAAAVTSGRWPREADGDALADNVVALELRSA